MKKKLLVLNTTIVLGLSSVFAIPGVNAESDQGLQQKKEAIQEKLSGVESGILNAEKEIRSLQGQQDSLEAQILRIEKAINDSALKIEEKSNQIKDTQAEIKQLEQEIIVLKERIKKRNELLKERAVSFQESGGDVSYLEVLLGSKSFSDFVGRVNAVATIVEADREILKQHEEDKKQLEENQKAVKEKLAELQGMLSELEEMKEQLTKQKQQKDTLMKKLEAEEKNTQNEKMDLQEEAETLAAQDAAIQKAIELEQKRQAELEAARKRAAAEAAEAKARAKNNEQSATKSIAKPNSGSARSNDKPSAAPSISAGNFTNPTQGVLTSQMGARWNKLHAGIDIAKAGTVPVVSAADGVVMRSYFSSSYGNVVFISHSIDGQLYTTVYAHMRSRSVSAGQVVSKGQLVGYQGNSGNSFGQHLHFELHKGPWNASKSNAVNPLDYIPM